MFIREGACTLYNVHERTEKQQKKKQAKKKKILKTPKGYRMS